MAVAGTQLVEQLLPTAEIHISNQVIINFFSVFKRRKEVANGRPIFKLFNFISPIIGGDRLCDGRGNSEAESWEPSQAKFKYKKCWRQQNLLNDGHQRDQMLH